MLEKLDSKNIFQAVKRSSNVRLFTAPSIEKQDGTLAIDNLSKQKSLSEELLTSPAPTAFNTDNQIDLSQETRYDIVLCHLCTMQEVEAGIIPAENNSSGLDEIPPTIIKKAWLVYCEEITSFFQQCLEEGYHPMVFKNIIPCAFPKPGKRCRALPRSYRLTAFLSCLGKELTVLSCLSEGLEKIVAKRLNIIAFRLQLISSMHFDAIARRSSVDAAATVTHSIEKSFLKQKILTALAIDIKGAFDRVIDHHLIQKLWHQKIPLPLIWWVSSILNDRTAVIRFDERTGDQKPVKIGVPR